MIVRSLHAGKPFYLGGDCMEYPGYTICRGRNLIIFNEIDDGEVFDITVYRTMVMFTEGGILDKMLMGLLASRDFSVPAAHADIGMYLDVEPLPDYGPPEPDLFGFVDKPAAIAELPEYMYIKILRESTGHNDYIYRMQEAPLVVAIRYWVETLTHVLKSHADEVAAMVEKEYGIPARAVKEALEASYMARSITEYVTNVVAELADLYDALSDLYFFLVRVAYDLVDQGKYVPPEIMAISVYKNGRYVAGGCEAARMVYNLLPERDQADVKRKCRI